MNNPIFTKRLIGVFLALSGLLGIYLVRHPAALSTKDTHQQGTILGRFSSSPESTTGDNKNLPLKQLSTSEVLSPTNGTRSRTVLFYEARSGRLMESSLQSASVTPLSDPLQNLSYATWSPDHSSVILALSTKKGFDFRYHNLKNNTWHTLPPNIQSLAFSPNGSQIVYFQTGENNNAIIISQPDGTIAKTILRTRMTHVSLQWPLKDVIALNAYDSFSDSSALFLTSLNGSLTRILSDVQRLETLWSHDGSRVLISFLDTNNQSQLAIYSPDTRTFDDVSLSTSASRCAFTLSDDGLVCGMSPTSNTTSPTGNDEIREISLQTNTSQLLYRSTSTPIGVAQIFLTPTQDYVVFVNRFDGKLYAVEHP